MGLSGLGAICLARVLLGGSIIGRLDEGDDKISDGTQKLLSRLNISTNVRPVGEGGAERGCLTSSISSALLSLVPWPLVAADAPLREPFISPSGTSTGDNRDSRQ